MNIKINKMKSILLKAFILLGGPVIMIKAASAQNSQPLSEFSRLKIEDDVVVELVIADRYSIYSDGGVKASVEGNGLRLSRNGAGSNKVKLFARELTDLRIDGAASITSTDTLRAGTLLIDIDGAGRASLLVSSERLSVTADGGSSLEIKGQADNASIRADGAARIRTKELAVGKLTVEADGASSVHVNAVNALTAKADGASNIRFAGDPQAKSFSVDGLANIKAFEGGQVYGNDIGAPEPPSEPAGPEEDTTRIKWGKRKLMIIEDKNDKEYGEEAKEKKHRRMKSVWGGFEMGLQGLATPEMNMSMPSGYKFLNTKVGESWYFGLNTPELDGHIIRNKLAVTTGLGIAWNNIHFEGNNVLIPNIDSLAASPSPAGTNLSKNKMYTFDITAPLLLKFAPGTKKSAKGGFHIATGVIVHYVPRVRVVTETSSGGYDHREELNDNFNVNPFRADATVRIGYDRIKLFANYALTPYFNSSKAPDVRLFTAGLTLIGF
jgi:hypothetical protein